MTWLLFGIFMIATSSGALAFGGLPKWVLKTPSSDSQFRYYVGRSSMAATIETAVENANKNARESAIRDNFGSYSQIETVTTDSLTGSQSSSWAQEKSEIVNLSGMESIDERVVPQKDGTVVRYNAYKLYRFSKTAIERERQRLSTASQNQTFQFNQSGSQNCQPDQAATLEILSSEPNAKIFVDDEPVGFTPLQIKCKFNVGRPLKVILDHPKYKTFKSEVTLSQGGTQSINAILEPATVKLIITSKPTGAKVSIPGLVQTVTPTSEFEAPAGTKLQVYLSHPEAEAIAQQIELEKEDESTSRNFEMTPLPSFLGISSRPSKAEVMLDGVSFGAGLTPTGLQSCPTGPHEVTLSKEGYRIHTQTINCQGGQKHILPVINLERWTGPEYRLSYSLGVREQTIAGVDMYMSQQGASYLQKLSNRWGVSMDFLLVSGKTIYDSSTLESKGYSIGAGLPFFFFRSLRYSPVVEIFIQPDIEFISQRFTANYPSGNSISTTGKNQLGYGLSAGGQILPNDTFDQSGWFITFRTGLRKFNDADQVFGRTSGYLTISGGHAW